MRVVVSTAAIRDLDRILAQGKLRYGSLAAEKYIFEVKSKFILLGDYPLMMAENTSVRPPVRILPFKGHLIIYRVHADYLQILRTLSRFENWQEAM